MAALNKVVVQAPSQSIAHHGPLADLAADDHRKTQRFRFPGAWPEQFRCCRCNPKQETAKMGSASSLVEVVKDPSATQSMPFRQNHSR